MTRDKELEKSLSPPCWSPETLVEHKLTSFFDGGSCSLPVFLGDRHGFCDEIPSLKTEEGTLPCYLEMMDGNLGNLALGSLLN